MKENERPEPSRNWPAMVQVSLAAVFLLSLFLPVFNENGRDYGFFSKGAADLGLELGAGITLLLLALLVLGLTTPLLFTVNRGLRIAAGVVGILAGLAALFILIVVATWVAVGLKPGDQGLQAGAVLGLVASTLIALWSIVLLSVRQQ